MEKDSFTLFFDRIIYIYIGIGIICGMENNNMGR
jgi:hypothetical protein